MTPESSEAGGSVTRLHRSLLLAGALLTYVLIVLGSLVCITGSARGCPDWPGCYGQIIPPGKVDAVVEYAHRITAGVTGPVVLAAAVVGLRRARGIRWVSRPPAYAIGFLLAVVVFGALAVLRGLPPGVAAVDLGSALMVQALMTVAAVMAFVRRPDRALPDRLALRGGYAWLTTATLPVVYLVLVSAVLVAAPGSLARCVGWPLISSQAAPVNAGDWLPPARLVLAGAADVMIVAAVVGAWRTQRERPAVLRAAAIVGALFLVEMAAGGLLLALGPVVALLVIYSAAAAGLWAMLVALGVLSLRQDIE